MERIEEIAWLIAIFGILVELPMPGVDHVVHLQKFDLPDSDLLSGVVDQHNCLWR